MLLLLAQADGELHRGQQARTALRRLIAEFPQSNVLDRAHYRLGELAYADGDLPAAAAEYGQVLDRWPRSPLVPRGLYGLGWVKLSQNDYAGAERLFDTLLEKYPRDKLAPVRSLCSRHSSPPTKGLWTGDRRRAGAVGGRSHSVGEVGRTIPVGALPGGPEAIRRGRRQLPSHPPR